MEAILAQLKSTVLNRNSTFLKLESTILKLKSTIWKLKSTILKLIEKALHLSATTGSDCDGSRWQNLKCEPAFMFLIYLRPSRLPKC